MPEAPHREYSPQQQAAGRGQPEGVATVTSFITELNQNAAIFQAAVVWVSALFVQTQQIAVKHEAQVNALTQQVNALKEQVDRLARFGSLYRPPEDRSPVAHKGPR
ncbi:MAG: MbeD/MobD family mobilization/exclusion protein [Chloroflexota bacterium]|nr:MbeD/MobD family mobilization/exclusion protein [Chloroflexota bacterium]